MNNRFKQVALTLGLAFVLGPACFAVTPTPTPTPRAGTVVDSTKTPSRFLTQVIAPGLNVQVFMLVDENGEPVSLGGGGGAGDASAANQTTQITAEQAIQATLGPKTDAKSTATDTTSISLVAILKQISASVQAPPSQAVTGPLTDTQLRATAVPISIAAALPAGTNLVGKVGIDQTTPGTTNAVQLSGAQLTIAETSVSTDDTITAGKFHIEFIFASDFAGTINGVAYSGATDTFKEYTAPPGRTFSAVDYTISAGSARLTTW